MLTEEDTAVLRAYERTAAPPITPSSVRLHFSQDPAALLPP